MAEVGDIINLPSLPARLLVDELGLGEIRRSEACVYEQATSKQRSSAIPRSFPAKLKTTLIRPDPAQIAATMDHHLGGFDPAGALTNISRFFSQPFLNATGRIDLAKVGLASVTVKSGLNVFVKSVWTATRERSKSVLKLCPIISYRQLRHMSSPAYRAPKHWGSPDFISQDGSQSPYQKAFDKVKHRLQRDILSWSSSLVVDTVMLFG